ncbi:ABC transporter ATP-binding protein [Azospirillum brasilense]|uniref:ABC transporter ATP-binding protein n=1 Tax=Azospirillum brasilense TaxID=192 RepID=UPI000E6814CE|nr:ABC transporter ATP-binding protein [Azospirillum brasilense]NUB28771.1 ATP-binding cassette domain-containing protein [Azospirillum brasilense]NUB33991.1 ATP-binding cassette domain-containing protein [Azospirillum brasilense]RIW01498.1 ABC transporter ATP-binding protein [Azospirillum brasilense]
MTARLTIKKLAFGYGERTVGAGVGFGVEAGEVLCLLGPNGGGRTTLFKTILGLLPPRAGRVLVDGDDLGGWGLRRRAMAFGYVPQACAGQFPFSVREMVLMGRTAHRSPFAAPSARTTRRLRRRSTGSASVPWRSTTGCASAAGEQQPALIARGLSQAPRVLVLNQPTASLLEQVRRLAREGGWAVVFSTHKPEQAFAIADCGALPQEGRLARLGTPDAVITTAMMREVYGTKVDVLPVGDTGLRVCVPRGVRCRA